MIAKDTMKRLLLLLPLLLLAADKPGKSPKAEGWTVIMGNRPFLASHL